MLNIFYREVPSANQEKKKVIKYYVWIKNFFSFFPAMVKLLQTKMSFCDLAKLSKGIIFTNILQQLTHITIKETTKYYENKNIAEITYRYLVINM